MKPELTELIDLLRGRILRALQASALASGDRLPSAREVAVEMEVDHRVVLSAYRALAEEKLVELRQRGGIYVAPRLSGAEGVPRLPARWFADVLAQGLSREIPAGDLHEWLRRCTETRRLRVAVITTTADQGAGLCRELVDDYGFLPEALLASEVQSAVTPPLALRRADLFVTTESHGDWVKTLASELRKEVCVIEVRPNLVRGEWTLLFRRPLYVVVADANFGGMLRRFFAGAAGEKNLIILVVGRDDVSVIPQDAPTYVTQHARSRLDGVPIRGRVLPAARSISPSSARELFGFVVGANIEALHRDEKRP